MGAYSPVFILDQLIADEHIMPQSEESYARPNNWTQKIDSMIREASFTYLCIFIWNSE